MTTHTLCGMGTGDFNSKLSGSIFRVNGEVFQLNHVGDRGDDDDLFSDNDSVVQTAFTLHGSVLDDLAHWMPKTFDPDEGTLQVDLSFPIIGYVNYKSGAVYMSRNAERQYKMGYNHRIAKVSDRFKAERNTIGVEYARDVANNAHFVARLFDRFFFTYDHAISLVRSGKRLGAAISPYIYIGTSGEYDNPIICYKDKVVGYVDGTTNYLFPDAEYVGKLLPSFQLKQETDDVSLRTNWN